MEFNHVKFAINLEVIYIFYKLYFSKILRGVSGTY